MKKTILGLAIVFGLMSFTLNNEDEVYVVVEDTCCADCYEFAESQEQLHGGGYETFSKAYDECEWREGKRARPNTTIE